MSETSTDNEIGIRYRTPVMWTVVFINDDFTPMPFVVYVLVSIYNQSPQDANEVMLLVHNEGRARVGTYTKEVACNKAEMTLAFAFANQHPLCVYPEPL